MTEQAKHSPGPWEAWNAFGSRTLQNWRVGERNSVSGVVRPIAVVLSTEVQRSPEESVANANLIAAAPELLEALEGCLDALTPFRNTEEMRAVNAARAAIAKAKGL